MTTNGSGAAESNLSAEAAEFVPHGYYVTDTFESHDESAILNGECGAVVVTDAAMLKLLSNPEAFFEVVNPLVDCLSMSITDAATLEAVVEHIFQQSIFQSNYQYTGARLCAVLSEKLNLALEVGGFRDVLFKRCKTEFTKRDDLSRNGLEELVGFTLFFAELLLNIKVEGLLKAFAPQIFALLLLLLSSADHVRCGCVNKVLKLTGSALESTNPAKMDEVFARVKDVVVHSDTTKQLRRLLLCLVQLRARKWEVESEAIISTTQNGNTENLPEAEFHDENGEIVYEDYAGETEGYDYGMYANYVPDGYAVECFDPVEITEENYEAWVPEEETGEFDGISYVIGDDEMDPEMDEAYEQFLEQMNPSSSSEKSGK